jgi:two-component system OmpR family sensor kinase
MTLVRRLPIRLRLTLAFALVLAVVLGATGAFVYLRMENELDNSIDQGLRSRASDLVALVRQSDEALAEAGHSPLTERGENVAQILTPRARVLDATPRFRKSPLLIAADLRRAFRHTLIVDHRHVRGLDSPVRLLGAPARAQGRKLVVVVGTPLDDRNEALKSLLLLLLIGGPVALLLASLAGYGVAAAALRPVESMRREAAEVSVTEPGRRLPVPEARDEVGRLGETLNDMLARLEVAFARERRFVSDASHELRTPLAILRTELELALRQGRTIEELEAALQSAAEETDRLSQLAEDLLVIARSDQGGLPVRKDDVPVAELLDRARERYARRAEQAGRGLRLEPDGGGRVPADRLRVDQALVNLLENAMRHGAGEVVLFAKEGNGAVELHVRDGGPGFPEGLLPAAFERFTRGDPARSRGGAGLGLPIVAAIAEAHGGTAGARNLADGGADVWIVLPRS